MAFAEVRVITISSVGMILCIRIIFRTTIREKMKINAIIEYILQLYILKKGYDFDDFNFWYINNKW